MYEHQIHDMRKLLNAAKYQRNKRKDKAASKRIKAIRRNAFVPTIICDREAY